MSIVESIRVYLNYVLIGILTAFLFLLAACSEDPLVLNESTQPTIDAEVEDIASDDISADSENDPNDVGPKTDGAPPSVECEYRGESRSPSTFFPNSMCTGSGASGTRRGYSGRVHMGPDISAMQSWLSTDQYFVIDGYWCIYGTQSAPMDYRVSVFHNGRRLPFHLIQIPEPDCYPTIDDIEAWDSRAFTYENVITRQPDVSYNYTIVVPPWAFPEEGGYNIQFIATPIWEPSTDRILLRSGSYNHSAHTVYFGSDDWIAAEPEISDRQHEAVQTELEEIGVSFLNRTRGLFLAPPLDVYDWVELSHASESELADILELSSPEVTLTLHLKGMEFPFPDNQPKGLYYVRQDQKIIEKFTIEPGEGTFNDGEPGISLKIDVDVGEEVSAIDIIGLPRGHKPYIDLGPPAVDTNPLTSNTLLLQYKPE